VRVRTHYFKSGDTTVRCVVAKPHWITTILAGWVHFPPQMKQNYASGSFAENDL